MRHQFKFATVVAVAATLNACAAEDLQVWKRGEKGSQEFHKLLLKGKAPAAFPTTSARGFSLAANPNVVTTEVDPGDGRASFIAYDTSRMVDVPRSDLRAAALAHVDAHKESFGVPSSELRDMDHPVLEDAKGNVTLSFQRFVEGIPVDSSLLQVAFAPAGADVYRLRHVVNHTYGDIKISATEKMNVSDAGLVASLGLNRMIELGESRVIYPSVNEKGVYEHTLATRLLLEDPESGEQFTVTAKSSGELLEAVSSRSHVQHQLLVEVWDRTPSSNKRVEVPLGYVTLQNQTTDKDGKADLTLGQATAIPFTTANNGSRTRIGPPAAGRRQSSNPNTITVTTVAGTDKTVYPLTAATLPGVNAYVKVNIVADFVKGYLPTNPMVARQIPTIVNLNVVDNQAASCNAFYDGQSLNFFAADNQCQNTALIDDVVYHEWGHGLDDLTGPQRGITDGAYSEGIGDILSMLLTGSNNLAPGFLLANPANGIRNLDNKKRYPGDLVNRVHDDGEIIGGTFWDMRKALVARYGQAGGVDRTAKLFLGSLVTTTRYLDSYQQVLLLDDDDNNPATRSPNFCLLNAAYAGHGLATLEPNCFDSVTATDESLKLAIRSMSGGAVLTFYGASSSESVKIGVCLGEREACISSKKVDAEFVDDRVTADGIKIYKSDSPIQVTDGQMLTILSFDASGGVRGVASAKLTRSGLEP